MKNKDQWKPSKFVYKHGKLVASRDPREVGHGSRLITDIVAGLYDGNIKSNVKGRLLDLGCGNVPLFEAYKDYVTDNTCIDWGNSPHGNQYLDFEWDLTTRLPFETGAFDTIILSDVLEHIPEPLALWKEMSRVLSANGRLIMNTPFYYWLHEQPYDYYRYTEFALRRFVESSGLSVALLTPIGGAPEIMADVFAKNILSLPKLGRPLAVLTQQITSAFIKTRFGTKVSAQTGRSFPLGYFLIATKPSGVVSRAESGAASSSPTVSAEAAPNQAAWRPPERGR